MILVKIILFELMFLRLNAFYKDLENSPKKARALIG